MKNPVEILNYQIPHDDQDLLIMSVSKDNGSPETHYFRGFDRQIILAAVTFGRNQVRGEVRQALEYER